MNIFLSDFEQIADPRAENARHDLRELLVVAFVSVLCGTKSGTEMVTFGRPKVNVFRGFLKLKVSIPSHDILSALFRMIGPTRLDGVFGKFLAVVVALIKYGDALAIDDKALGGARDKSESVRTRMDFHIWASL